LYFRFIDNHNFYRSDQGPPFRLTVFGRLIAYSSFFSPVGLRLFRTVSYNSAALL